MQILPVLFTYEVYFIFSNGQFVLFYCLFFFYCGKGSVGYIGCVGMWNAIIIDSYQSSGDVECHTHINWGRKLSSNASFRVKNEN